MVACWKYEFIANWFLARHILHLNQGGHLLITYLLLISKVKQKIIHESNWYDIGFVVSFLLTTHKLAIIISN